MNSVLIAARTEKGAEFIKDIIKNRYYTKINVCLSGSETRRHMLNYGYDLLIISAPLTDENGVDMAVELSLNYKSNIVLLVKADIAEEIAERVNKYGVFTIDKPISRSFLLRVISYLDASGKRFMDIKKENEGLHRKIEELRIVNRAKYILMQYLSFTEEQAHRYIEKQAMDLRQTKIKIAENILKTYDI
ncbi:MAG: ANTAR domain-containing protein [Lachnospiraceae bacterium]|jgi:response regulator NasT|nr:ANTAR domain-containing protein [Lachnospiraceae bacterium]